MQRTHIPAGYVAKLGLYETQGAIELIKRTFLEALSAMLRLKRVSAPLFVNPADGLNDNLNGVERPVSFDIPATGATAEVVHSLAKWKRYALGRYGFHPGKGIVTDMNAIRREERTLDYLKSAVQSIVDALYYTQQVVCARYDELTPFAESTVSFVTAQALLDMYPGKTPKEREYQYVREHGTSFIIGIGDTLSNGEPHDGRAPDYDDWSLNGDILTYNPLLDCAFELSSMGVRVDAAALDRQLVAAHCEDRRALPFHKMLLNDELPLTIGGGIGQSRMCMLLLNKAHIGEVQSSLWDADTLAVCRDAGVTLL